MRGGEGLGVSPRQWRQGQCWASDPTSHKANCITAPKAKKIAAPRSQPVGSVLSGRIITTIGLGWHYTVEAVQEAALTGTCFLYQIVQVLHVVALTQ